MSSSEKVFYGGNTQFSYAACKWIERQAELLGKHIHHALCGHGGEYCVTIHTQYNTILYLTWVNTLSLKASLQVSHKI